MARITFKKMPRERYTFRDTYEVKLNGQVVAHVSPDNRRELVGLYFWSTNYGGWRNTAAEKDFRELEAAKAQCKEHILKVLAATSTATATATTNN